MSNSQESTSIGNSGRLHGLKLDPSHYLPLPDEIKFLKEQTGIEDEEELKNHIVSVQTDAWQIENYLCIQNFLFTKLKISFLSAYPLLLAMGKERPDAIFLDLGCCFGNDVRKAVADGFPIKNCIASDIQREFWELGHKLYRSTPEIFPVPFITGDIFDPNHLAPAPPSYSAPTTPKPILSTLTSLTPLHGRVSAIHTSQFFHLFNKEQQVAVAHSLASLLSPEPGSMIFGEHVTMRQSGDYFNRFRKESMWCFGQSDWEKLWKEIFSEGKIEVKSVVHDIRSEDNFANRWLDGDGSGIVAMEWYIRRL